LEESSAELWRYVDNWGRHLRDSQALAAKTVIAYLSDIRVLINFLQRYKEEDITINHLQKLRKHDIRAWFLQKREKGESVHTLARGLSAVKNFLKYLIEIELIRGNELLSLKPPKVDKFLPRPMSIAQINDILNVIHDIKHTAWIVKRDRAILLLLYSVGLRIAEALSLDRSAVALSATFMEVVGKGDKARHVPLLKPVLNIIQEYLKECPFKDTTALFVNKSGGRLSATAVQKLVRQARILTGLTCRVTPHALRHSCATHLMEKSGDLRGIQELLGHASISSTQVYVDVAQKYVSDVYEKCHPLSTANKQEGKK
jgi:integrase/recombinase XerC